MSLAFDELSHTYTFDGEPVLSVTQALNLAGFGDWLREIPEDVLHEASERGRAVHKAIELSIERRLDGKTVSNEIAGYLWAFWAFCKESKFRPDPNKLERLFFHKHFRYAGTLDIEGKIGNETVLIDWKSGGVQSSAALQLAAYQNHAAMPLKRRRLAIQLRRDGTYRVHEFPRGKAMDDFAVFLAALKVANFRITNNKEVAPWSK